MLDIERSRMYPRKLKNARKQVEHAIVNNNDILIEILLCLPVKSLLRFKSVSKHWQFLISNPRYFPHIHPDPYSISGLLLRRSSFLLNPEYEFVPLKDNPQSAPFKSLSFLNDQKGAIILHSCNRLLLCSSFSSSTLLYDYYILNPTTKQFITLPKPGGPKSRGAIAVNLVFEPTKSHHYKVLWIEYEGSRKDEETEDELYYIEIYSSETGSWKRFSGDPFAAHINTLFCNGIFCNGAVHWISWWGTSLYMKLDEEVVQELPMPSIPEGWEERRYKYFKASRNHLHLIEIYHGPTGQFDVYELERDYSKWFVKYRVNLDALVTSFPNMVWSDLDPLHLHYYKFEVLHIVREEKDEDSYMVLHIPGKAISYNLKNKTFKKICDFSPRVDVEGFHFEDCLSFSWCSAHQFVESFSSI